MVTPKALAGTPLGRSGMMTLALPRSSGWKVPAGMGALPSAGDDPELIGFVLLERVEVAGEEDQRALVGVVGDAAGGRLGRLALVVRVTRTALGSVSASMS